jgi:hypothetical protein
MADSRRHVGTRSRLFAEGPRSTSVAFAVLVVVVSGCEPTPVDPCTDRPAESAALAALAEPVDGLTMLLGVGYLDSLTVPVGWSEDPSESHRDDYRIREIRDEADQVMFLYNLGYGGVIPPIVSSEFDGRVVDRSVEEPFCYVEAAPDLISDAPTQEWWYRPETCCIFVTFLKPDRYPYGTVNFVADSLGEDHLEFVLGILRTWRHTSEGGIDSRQ